MMDVRALGDALAASARIGLKSFAATFCSLLLAGGILAAASCYFLWDTNRLVASVFALIALVEAISTGVAFGVKRAVLTVAGHALGSLRLGGVLAGLVFDRIGRGAGGEQGEPGGTVARALQRLPLAQAEALLGGAVRGLTGDADGGGWMRRKIQAYLLGSVSRYTLARFREADAAFGGIDLAKVREGLEETIDRRLAEKARGGLALTTWLVILGLPLTVAAQTFVALFLLTKGKL